MLEKNGLETALAEWTRLQGISLTSAQLRTAIDSIDGDMDVDKAIARLSDLLSLNITASRIAPDLADLPFLVKTPDNQWLLLVNYQGNERWQARGKDGLIEIESSTLAQSQRWSLRSETQHLSDRPSVETSFRPVFKKAYRKHKFVLAEAIVASIFIGAVSLGISLFSMQVYDRVIPARSESTLIALGAGVLLAILVEFLIKSSRAWLMESITFSLDRQMNRTIFERLMSVRIDALPSSVGSLAAQLRSFDQVRSFYTANSIFSMVDLPIGLLMLGVVFLLGGGLVAAIPLVVAVIALVFGAIMRHRLLRATTQSCAATNLKTGLLVEAVEGATTLKSGGGGWKFTARWTQATEDSAQSELKLRSISEQLGFINASLQQVSYACLVAAGAWGVMQGTMTMGALIACSIISGRVMQPILGVPALLLSQAHAQSAMKGLDQLFSLPLDNHGVTRPLRPSQISGSYSVAAVEFSYPNSPPALSIDQLKIATGEKVAVLGPIGSGKSSLLKLLAGLNCPSKGTVRIDGLDIQHIDRASLIDRIGYLQQEHRLFQGTLRDNLLIGMADPGDAVMKEAMERSGLTDLVSRHPKGLDLPILEGGQGLSGGQRQLVAFTRLLLQRYSVLLLDEPTANMDPEQEQRCIKVLTEEVRDHSPTLVVVTHKSTLLPLVDRIILVSGNKVIMDGPRQAVLERLRGGVSKTVVSPKLVPVSQVSQVSQTAASAV